MIVHKRRRGRGLLNNLINNLPVELHLPGYQYCGPGTKLKKRLARGDPGINPLDAACKEHDIAYSQNRENVEARNAADRVLADKAWRRVLTKDSGLAEKAAAYTIANAMKLKSKLGMGFKRKKKNPPVSLNKVIKSVSTVPTSSTRKAIRAALENARDAVKQAGGKSKVKVPRILPIPKKLGGFLPFLIPLFAGLSATGALAGGAAGIAKAVNDFKAAQQQLAESQRHNQTMETIALGKGLYLKPYKTGLGLHLVTRKKKKILEVRLPQRALSNIDLIKFAKLLKIPHFRGVYMRDSLPDGPQYSESAIVNLDNASGPGTHWVAFRKRGNHVVYFDSFGDLQPPRDLMLYLGVDEIHYNHERYQNFDTFDCGHLCLKFLSNELERGKLI